MDGACILLFSTLLIVNIEVGASESLCMKIPLKLVVGVGAKQQEHVAILRNVDEKIDFFDVPPVEIRLVVSSSSSGSKRGCRENVRVEKGEESIGRGADGEALADSSVKKPLRLPLRLPLPLP